MHFTYSRDVRIDSGLNLTLIGDTGEDGNEISGTNIWMVSYPPSLSLTEDQYYFYDWGVLRTPYGRIEIEHELATSFSFPTLQMWKKYIPWIHLSNGRVMLQGFEILEERHVWFRGPKKDENFPEPIEITDALAAVAETDISNIQTLIIDVPLARIREFV